MTVVQESIIGGDFSAEQSSPAGELCVDINRFIATNPNCAQDSQSEYAVRKLLGEIKFIEKLDMAAGDHRGVAEVLEAANRLQAAVGGQNLTTWMLGSVHYNDQLKHTIQTLFTDNDPNLTSLLQGAIADQSTSIFSAIRLIEKIVEPQYGKMYEWKQIKGPLPSLLQSTIAKPKYESSCIRAGTVDKQHASDESKKRIDSLLLESVLGLSPHLSHYFQEAMSNRRPDNEIGQGGLLHDLAERVEWFGSDVINKIHSEAGIVSFDRYSRVQLERMRRLVTGDRTVIPKGRPAKLVISDAMDGPRDGLKDQIAEYEDDEDDMFFCEVVSPAGIYLQPVRLSKHGLHPSILGVVLHGDKEGLGFEIDGSLRVEPAEINQSQLDRFLRKYMQPHPDTGERIIILSSCQQAEHLEGGNVPITIVNKTNYDDKVVVSASDSYITDITRLDLTCEDDVLLVEHLGLPAVVKLGTTALFYFDVNKDKFVPAHIFRRTPYGMIEVMTYPFIPGSQAN